MHEFFHGIPNDSHQSKYSVSRDGAKVSKKVIAKRDRALQSVSPAIFASRCLSQVPPYLHLVPHGVSVAFSIEHVAHQGSCHWPRAVGFPPDRVHIANTVPGVGRLLDVEEDGRCKWREVLRKRTVKVSARLYDIIG